MPRLIAVAVLLALAGCASPKYPWPNFAVADDAWRPAHLSVPPSAVTAAR